MHAPDAPHERGILDLLPTVTGQTGRKSHLLDSKENRCRSAILETCSFVNMNACGSSLTISLMAEGMCIGHCKDAKELK
jgi:hypothetical protein